MLLMSKAKPDAQAMKLFNDGAVKKATAMHLATRGGYTHIVTLLLAFKANPNAKAERLVFHYQPARQEKAVVHGRRSLAGSEGFNGESRKDSKDSSDETKSEAT